MNLYCSKIYFPLKLLNCFYLLKYCLMIKKHDNNRSEDPTELSNLSHHTTQYLKKSPENINEIPKICGILIH